MENISAPINTTPPITLPSSTPRSSISIWEILTIVILTVIVGGGGYWLGSKQGCTNTDLLQKEIISTPSITPFPQLTPEIPQDTGLPEVTQAPPRVSPYPQETPETRSQTTAPIL